MTMDKHLKDQRGVASLEFVLILPILLFVLFASVELSRAWFTMNLLTTAAREAARVARVTGDGGAASERAFRTINNIGDGVLDRPNVRVAVGAEQARVTVSGEASKILPFLPIPRVTETVEGPIERFVPDGGAP